MNWLNRKIPALTAGLGIILIAVIGCHKEDAQTITDELRVSAGNNLYFNPLNVQLFDAKDESSYPDNATITVVGEDKSKILSVLGDRTIPIKNGIIELGVKRHTEADELDFGLVIDAPGYVKTFKSYHLTCKKTTQDEIRMFKLSDLPSGVEAIDATATLNAQEQMTGDVVLTAGSDLSVTFKAGTVFRGALRQILSGDVKMSLVRFDATQEVPMDGYPMGLSHDNATGQRGENLGEGVFTPFGFYNLQVTVGGVEAKYVSTPIDITMRIPTEIKRGLSDDAAVSARAGNGLDYWSLNEASYEWHKEGTTSVIPTAAGTLQVRFKQTHLSYWAVQDRRGDRTCLNPGFRANYTPTPDADASETPCFRMKVRNANNPHMTLGATYVNLSTNPSVDLRRMVRRTNQKVTLDFYDNQGGTLLSRVERVMSCGRPTVDLNELRGKRNEGGYINFNINMNAICRNGTQVTNFRPSASIYAAEVNASGKLVYHYIGTMVDGKMSTCLLKKGVPYVFKVVRGPLSATTIDLGSPSITFPVVDAKCTLPFKNPAWGLNQEVTAFPTALNTYLLSLPDFEAPAYLCNKWFQYFR
ncbi:MAG: hypothetical protein RLZZ628_2354 [Bacteroidota bacterium]|jgi:hypothetical protein